MLSIRGTECWDLVSVKIIRGVGYVTYCQLDFGCCQKCWGQSGVWFIDLESDICERGVGSNSSPARKAGARGDGGGGSGGGKGEGSREQQGGKQALLVPTDGGKSSQIVVGFQDLGSKTGVF